MKFAITPVLGASLLMTVLATAPLAYAGEQHDKNGGGAPGQHSGKMMSMETMKGRMHDMSEMVNEAHATKDVNKRHELMQKHMAKMQDMMGNMKGMMGDKMKGNMAMEDRQKMQGKRMDMMQGMMEQMMKQQSMMMNMSK